MKFTVHRLRLRTMCVGCSTLLGLLSVDTAHAEPERAIDAVLDAPSHHIGCGDEEFLDRAFQRAMGARMRTLVSRPTIHVRIEETAPFLFRLHERIEQKGHKPVDLPPLDYDTPTSCLRVVYDAADFAAGIVRTSEPPAVPEPPRRPHSSVETPRLSEALESYLGILALGGILPNVAGAGAEVGLGVHVRPNWNFRVNVNAIWPALWSWDKDSTFDSSRTAGIFASLAPCRVWKPRYELCVMELNLGFAMFDRYTATGIPVQEAIPIFNVGPRLFVWTKPFGDEQVGGPFRANLNLGVYLNVTPIGVAADETPATSPAWWSGRFGLGVTF